MPFTFKLSKRLALMKASLFTVVQVVLSPSTLTPHTDDLAQLTAVGRTVTGVGGTGQ
jgi:hypothetical protein